MADLKLSYCQSCKIIALQDIYISEGNFLHSLCTNCGKDVESSKRICSQNVNANKECTYCKNNTEHVRYLDEGGFIHWFCCSCGKDIESNKREE